jgi:hypothetical protein
METPEAYDLKAYPTCKICDRGTLMPRKIRRLSGPAVAIGYILLIPLILGMAGCAILLIVSLLAGVAGAAHGSAFATAFAGIGAIAFVYIGTLSFVFGLVGWLLIMKKHVLQCGYCGAVVDAAAAVHSQPNRSFGRASVFGFFFLFLILVAITVVLTHKGNTPAQPTPDNSTAEPAQPDAWQPFTSADGRFSVLFPETPQQSSQPSNGANDEEDPGMGTVYMFSANAENSNISYTVSYSDVAPDLVKALSPQGLMYKEEEFLNAGTTVISEQNINLNGVPGHAWTDTVSDGINSSNREFLAGNRLYTLMVVAQKGYTATHADQFMNSFRIQ